MVKKMRILSETKLAIDDLYERIKEQNRVRVPTAGVKEDAGDVDHFVQCKTDLKTWLDKLHALQFRILDLQDIASDKFKGK
jgi:hypothetical protein